MRSPTTDHGAIEAIMMTIEKECKLQNVSLLQLAFVTAADDYLSLHPPRYEAYL